ncbi:MAG TPA: AraC family transcriptional regulator [Pyrinomonadaceae bacterium]|nr:AraC family transcriptional regulator [Pyrinomonadaceae bacterium]
MASMTRAFEDETYQRLCRARRFIDEGFDQPLSLDQISGEACFSRYHFLRLFRRAFNITPHQYLTEKRIERAKELLAYGKLSVTDICFEVGFQSLGSFSNLFRKSVGYSPIVYRTRTAERPVLNIPGQNSAASVPSCFLFMFGLKNHTNC